MKRMPTPTTLRLVNEMVMMPEALFEDPGMSTKAESALSGLSGRGLWRPLRVQVVARGASRGERQLPPLPFATYSLVLFHPHPHRAHEVPV